MPDDPPVAFRWRRVLHHVRSATGPERIADEWWRKSGTLREAGRVRDYYRLEDENGARFWVFRAGLHGEDNKPSWYLHGLFA
jgi:protein ImuB